MLWHGAQREETKGGLRVGSRRRSGASAELRSNMALIASLAVAEFLQRSRTRVCERNVLVILTVSCVSVCCSRPGHNSIRCQVQEPEGGVGQHRPGGAGHRALGLSLHGESRLFFRQNRDAIAAGVSPYSSAAPFGARAARPPPCLTACPSRGSLHRPLPERTRTHSTTLCHSAPKPLQRSTSVAALAAATADEHTTAQRPLRLSRGAGLAAAPSLPCSLHHVLSPPCAKVLTIYARATSATTRATPLLSLHALSTPHAIHDSRFLGAGSFEPSASAPPTTSARR